MIAYPAGRLVMATTATIRRTLVAVPARLARSARRIALHLPEAWPWQNAFARLFTLTHAPTANSNHLTIAAATARPRTTWTTGCDARISPLPPTHHRPPITPTEPTPAHRWIGAYPRARRTVRPDVPQSCQATLTPATDGAPDPLEVALREAGAG